MNRAVKNLILAGVKSVTLHDENSVQLWDLSGCYTFSEKDVGMNKAIVSCNKLQNIQSTVEISAITRKLSTDDLSKFQVYRQIEPFFCLCLRRSLFIRQLVFALISRLLCLLIFV